MFSACKLLTALALLAATLAFAEPPVLRVCADGNNLPYSNAQHQGFENRLAEMVARDLGRQIRYVWWPQNPIKAEKMFRTGACDVTMEMPTGSRIAQPTHRLRMQILDLEFAGLERRRGRDLSGRVCWRGMR